MTMQRIWIAVASVWTMLLLVAVLAWTYRPAQVLAQPAPRSIVVKTAHGQQLILVQPAAGPTHATTHTSGVPR